MHCDESEGACSLPRPLPQGVGMYTYAVHACACIHIQICTNQQNEHVQI